MGGVDVMASAVNIMSTENGVRRLPSSSGVEDFTLCYGMVPLDHGVEDEQSDNKLGEGNQLEENDATDSSSAEAKGETISHTESKMQAVSKTTNHGLSNARQAVEDYANVDTVRDVRSESFSISTKQSQASENVRSAASAIDVSLPMDSKKHRKNLKPLKQLASDTVEEHPNSTLSSKPRRLGATPSYSFSFKCYERAEKRKEFFSKLEEKIHAKEAEISTLQAKTKETQEAEMRLLRKSLTFKATPMPSFYQEPAPPKVELKKVPPTRAKSPKLGRQKTSTASDANGSRTSRSTRLSLDDGVSQNGLAKDFPLHSKKHQRRSLPRLLSEKTNPANNTETAPPAQQPDDQKLGSEGTRPFQTEEKSTEHAGEEGDAIDPELVRAPIGTEEQLVSEPVNPMSQ